MQNLLTIIGPHARMTDDELFAEIEADEQRKRRLASAEPGVGVKVVNSFQSLFRDIKDGFSLPKGAYIKYAR